MSPDRKVGPLPFAVTPREAMRAPAHDLTKKSTRDPDSAARGARWADPELRELEDLLRETALRGWREALRTVEGRAPFFATRMRNLSLGNWHLLLARPGGVALDVGCGFGSLALGLGAHHRTVLGVDALPSRLAYAALRAEQEGREGNVFARASGFALPIRDGTIDLATMNGVLEWAGLYADGEPRALQLAMLREMRRVLAPEGALAVAIENRYAMETLAGMPDTHTDLRLAPALPRPIADVLSRVGRRGRYRTYLYDARGYRRLARGAGYARVSVYDLVTSYNDYDFVVDPADAETYRLLWRRGLARQFHARAGRARDWVSRLAPGLLGGFGYAFLVLAGNDVTTALDASHRVWARASSIGVGAGRSRFACQGPVPGSLTIVTHDGSDPVAALTIRAERAERPTNPLGDVASALFARRPDHVGRWTEGDLEIDCWRR